MADLLREELERRGFLPRGKGLVRQRDGVTITVEPESGTVTVQAETAEQVELEATREGRTYEEWGPGGRDRVATELRKKLRETMRQEFDEQAGRKSAELQKQVTDRLEGQLLDLRSELDQVVNRVTAEALKRKAAQLGQIKELTEDPQNGSLTIVLEV